MLDEELLRAEVEAKEARMKSVLWSPPEEPAADQDWSPLLSSPPPSGSAAPHRRIPRCQKR